MKKYIFAFITLILVSLCLVGCKKKDDDDKNRFVSTSVYALVNQINDKTLNVTVGTINQNNMGGGSFNDGKAPGSTDNTTPPEMPNGEAPGSSDGTTPPEMPNGGAPGSSDSTTPPEMPNGDAPSMPSGEGKQSFSSYNITIDVEVDTNTSIVLSNQGVETTSSFDMIKVEDVLYITFDENSNVTKIAIINMSNTFVPNENQSYSHGSSGIVTSDMLKTEIPEGYDVNSETQDKAKNGTYANYFNTEDVEKVYINIDNNNWNYMLQNAIDKQTVLADSITIGDKTVEYVGMKTKGNLSLNSVWSSTSDRFSFTINFGKYIKSKAGYSDTQNFYGLAKVAFNNIYGDATLMKEYLSYRLMTEMGVDTPCYSLVDLYVNNEFWGVYMMVESCDSALTMRTMNEKSDFLVKPESSGGDLIYNSALDAYYDEETESFNFDSLIYEAGTTNLIYPSDKSNPLNAYCGLWENDEETFSDIVDILSTVFKWIKTINELSNSIDSNSSEYMGKVESIIDVDKVLRYFAVNTYLVNLDSYQSEKMQNYMLYINKSGYANIMPWDYNFSFGAYGIHSASDMVNFSIDNPVSSVKLEDRPLLNMLLKNDTYKALYYKYLNDCVMITGGGETSDGVIYDDNNYVNIINQFEKLLSVDYANDPTAFYTVAQYEKAIQNLKIIIADRNTAVLRQLGGDLTLVNTSADLSSLGNNTGKIGN